MSVIQKTKHDVYPFISPQHGLKYSAKGKTVLITGAGTGIGKAIAHTFALASAGTLVLAGRRPAPLDAVKASIESATPGCKVLTVPTDVTDQAAVEALFKRAGSVDVLINNAGSAAILKSVVDGDPSGWWKDYEINVKGVYLCTQAFLRLRSGKGGAIVNVTSLGAVFTSPGMSSYGSSKAALNRFTEFVDAENSNNGFRCIAFHPGGVADTEMAARAPESIKPLLIDTAELSAGTALYLSTERANYLGGRFVDATWDLEELEGMKDKIVQEDLFKTRITGI